MLFNTVHFWVFFGLVAAACFSLPPRARPLLLLVASYLFYMGWNPAYAVLMAVSTALGYFFGVALADPGSARRRRIILAASLVANFGLLFAYKYSAFAAGNLNALLRHAGASAQVPVPDLVLPVGISFFTFQAVGYLMDVYRGVTPAERNAATFSLFHAFFPQLVAGPIERSTHLLPQLRLPATLDWNRVNSGLRLAVWGLFKKMCIADLLSVVVNTVYAAPANHSGPALLLATLFFAIQIYCDFSGYSDIAVGIARILGFDIMTNFRQPYFAQSIAEFWRRWHISLSTWFRDYLYHPLGGNRVGPARWTLNILIVFLISGLWHGAAWTFIVWGALHGIYMVCGRLNLRLLGEARVRGLAPLRMAVVFALVLVGWVFFRARSVPDALLVLGRLGNVSGFQAGELWNLGLPRVELFIAFVWVCVLLSVEAAQEWRPGGVMRLWERRGLRWSCDAALFYAVVCFGVTNRVEFIYFQF